MIELNHVNVTYGKMAYYRASSKDLVRESKSNTLLPRLKKHLSFPVLFIFGEKSIGRYSSELLIKTHHLPIEYIPGAGHDSLQEDPEKWWTFFSQYYNQ